ncbi:M20 family metallopeptidase [Brevibacterium litoralis]|uniref:M20 family metallopeptidase n=1 Tax=Brevibacterium litoralis TaxID=3138935 RepID=UPI0032ED50E3
MTDHPHHDLRDLSVPTVPDDHYVGTLAHDTQVRARTFPRVTSDFAGASAALLDRVRAALDTVGDDLVALLHRIHTLAEPAFEEVGSAAAIADLLTGHGIDVERGVGGVATALRAAAGPTTRADGTPARSIGILAEYDALPGIGHACGHNVIATAGVGAFLALALAEKAAPGTLPGRVVLYGTPAEEGHGGKEHMARGGAFTDIDAAIMVHGYGYDAADQVWLGRRLLDVTFTGVAAHASAQPFMGRNALDAVNLMYQGLGVLRQQMPPIDRIHAVVTEGGTRPSIITERAAMRLYVRSKFPETLGDLSSRVEDAARGAALMTGTGVELTWDPHPATLPIRTNTALTGRWVAHERDRGRDPLAPGVLDESIAASTDFGNLSYRMPGIHPLVKVSGTEVALHTREFAEASATPAAESAGLDGAFGLAGTALDYLADDDLAASVHAEFEAAGGATDVPTYFD